MNPCPPYPFSSTFPSEEREKKKKFYQKIIQKNKEEEEEEEEAEEEIKEEGEEEKWLHKENDVMLNCGWRPLWTEAGRATKRKNKKFF